MEKATFNYSLKNIPVPSIEAYRKQLLGYTESFNQRMRFRAYHFLKNKDDEEDEEPRKETANQPKQIPLLKPFEEDLINLVSKV